ncbi:MAG: type III pantothenate kinase [Bacteroidota bacterium]|nr:type III pantothenate kinase [Bacteroidota bacterium]
METLVICFSCSKEKCSRLITFEAMEHGISLVIDIGNTRTKIALFDKSEIIESHSIKGNFSQQLSKLADRYGIPLRTIISKVALDEQELRAALEPVKTSEILFVRSGLRLPIRVLYKTPETLGHDRLSNVCAAWSLYPNRNCLVIDMGTCIKYDFISAEGTYQGGSISPGLAMRYKSLTRFTTQLPYFKPVDEFPILTGQSTEGSIRSGVENGILAELGGITNRYNELFDQTLIILTGGDAPRFADKLKSPIFVAPNLTLTGLKVILDHNDQ